MDGAEYTRNGRGKLEAGSWAPPASPRTGALQLAEDGYDLAFDLDPVWVDVDGLHLAVGRLQPDLVLLAVEPLERRLRVGAAGVQQVSHHHVAVLGRGRGLHDHDVAVVDQRVDHRLAAHLQRVRLAGREVARHRHEFVLAVDRLDGRTGGYSPEQRHLPQLAFRLHGRGQAQAARGVADALDVTLLLQDAEVVVHVAGGADAHPAADLPVRRRALVLGVEGLNEVEDARLLVAQILLIRTHALQRVRGSHFHT